MVNQQVVLFNRTVRDNIAYGQLENAKEEDIIAAAKAAYAHDFIMNLPQGYDTVLVHKVEFIGWSASAYRDCPSDSEKMRRF
jgi:ABC-type multidrug transport system fused ATPase/permease subunit